MLYLISFILKGKKSIWNNDHFNPVIIFNPVMQSLTLLFDSF